MVGGRADGLRSLRDRWTVSKDGRARVWILRGGEGVNDELSCGRGLTTVVCCLALSETEKLTQMSRVFCPVTRHAREDSSLFALWRT